MFVDCRSTHSWCWWKNLLCTAHTYFCWRTPVHSWHSWEWIRDWFWCCTWFAIQARENRHSWWRVYCVRICWNFQWLEEWCSCIHKAEKSIKGIRWRGDELLVILVAYWIHACICLTINRSLYVPVDQRFCCRTDVSKRNWVPYRGVTSGYY